MVRQVPPPSCLPANTLQHTRPAATLVPALPKAVRGLTLQPFRDKEAGQERRKKSGSGEFSGAGRVLAFTTGHLADLACGADRSGRLCLTTPLRLSYKGSAEKGEQRHPRSQVSCQQDRTCGQRQGRPAVLRSVKWKGDITHEVGHGGTFIGSRISGSSLLPPHFLSRSASPTLVQGRESGASDLAP